MPHVYNISNGRDAYDSEKVTMGVGEPVNPNQVGDIAGKACDKHGNQVCKGRMTKVVVIEWGN